MLLKVTSLIKQRPFQHSQHLGNFKSSESCEPETATKTKYTQEIHFGHLGGKSQYHQSQDQPLKKKWNGINFKNTKGIIRSKNKYYFYKLFASLFVCMCEYICTGSNIEQARTTVES